MHKETYKIMLAKMQIINNNFNNCIYELDKIKSKMTESIVINDSNFCNYNIDNRRNDLISKRNFIEYEVIPEIKNFI